MSLSEPYNSSNLSYQERLSHEKSENNDLIRNLKSRLSFLSPSRDDNSDKLSTSTENDPITNKEIFQIAISQDGKYAVTFDIANLRIRILENTDHRQFKSSKERRRRALAVSRQNSISQIDNETNEVNRTIAYFKINDSLDIDKFYDDPPQFRSHGDLNAGDSIDNRYRWSLDISNVQKYDIEKYCIFVAVSRIDVGLDMKRNKNNDTKRDYRSSTTKKRFDKIINEDDPRNHSSIDFTEYNKIKRGTAIYRLKLKKECESYDFKPHPVTYYYSDSVSGICKFVQDLKNTEQDAYTLKRFIVLNFNGIYNFEYNIDYRNLDLNKRFDYPKSINIELEHWHKENLTDCMDKLLTCIYNQYFLVEQYKNNVQILEVYDLEEMKLLTTPKRVDKKDKHIRKYNYNTFSISKLQLCFTRGLNSVKLYFMENGLEVVSKKFNEVEKIYTLEFVDSDEKLLIIGEKENKVKLVIWDIYNNGKIEQIILDNFPVKELGTRLARTSGNILQVGDTGRVMSILKKAENELLKKKQSEEINNNLKNYFGKKIGYKPDGKTLDPDHTIHYNEEFEPIVIEKEPWVIDNYKRNSYGLFQKKELKKKETLQLIVGRTTVQIWHQIQDDSKDKYDLPNKGGPFLEYIWANGIPVIQEREKTRLRIEEFKCGSNNGSSDILNDFYLRVFWYERVVNEKNGNEIDVEEENIEIDVMEQNRKAGTKILEKGIMERKEKVIRRKDIIEKVNAVRRACKALEHLNKRRSFLVTSFMKIHQYEEMMMYIKHIVWRFAKNNPEEYKLLDVRHNVMKKLILGDCSLLIKFILFGDNEKKNKEEKKEEFIIRHIPKSISWPGKKFIVDDDLQFDNNKPDIENNEITKPENDMELAIYRYKGRELKDTIVVAYLLEYYSSHATDYAGWMSTVSKALPLLFKYNYDDYARKLFRKKCFANQDYFSAQDPYAIIPKEYQAKRNHNIKFRAFRIDKLQSDEYKWYNRIRELFEPFKKMYRFFEDFDNDLEKSPLALRIVPLPEFTINRIPQEKVEQNFTKIILNAFSFIFVPRRYKINRNQKNLLSPFSRVLQYESNDDMYDNPATEAVVDFRWQKARNFFFLLFLRFFIFALCFVCVSWEYLVHEVISERYRNFLVALMIIFYYLAIYLLATELIQLYYHGPRKYFGDIFNSFDVFSVVIPVIVMSIMLKNFRFSDGFESVEIVDAGLMVGISLSIFFLWIEFVLYLRLISKIAIYIYYVIYIVKNILPFLLFMFIVVLAFAHTMFVLLKNPNNPKIDIKTDKLSGFATNTLTNERLDIELETDYDTTDRNDNPFSSLPTAILAAYFWLNGDMVQRDHFDFWAIEILTLIASVFLVTVLQNMLIAFMSGVYQNAETKGRQALLRFRANQIADYEALHQINFWPLEPEPEPKYIYYIGQSKNFQEWYNVRKDGQDQIYEDFEEKSTIIRDTSNDIDYDEVSIWKFGKYEHDSSNIKGKKKEGSIKSKSSIMDHKKENTSLTSEEIPQESIMKEINEIKELRDNINSLIDKLCSKYNKLNTLLDK